ncbi:MAG TPA: hypothetical protein VN520_29985 [Streptomyces sp.]|uniref:hypothetical protein n=1 Tax=Streptomyces sp. TaxID=1931 RepID=UPI002BCD5425|nr:hypothetical protein [Streptomyces sp.]HWU10545.1 hypothetical protein [Streptomyces sp.]
MTTPGQPLLLDWRDALHFRRDAPCRKPTPLRSHTGEAVHKICAENWNAQHPGETRLVSDAQSRRRKHDDHA